MREGNVNIYQTAVQATKQGMNLKGAWRLMRFFFGDLVSEGPGLASRICFLRKYKIHITARAFDRFHFIHRYSKHYAYCVHQDTDGKLVISKHKVGQCPSSKYYFRKIEV
jgi:hypothetical protein